MGENTSNLIDTKNILIANCKTIFMRENADEEQKYANSISLVVKRKDGFHELFSNVKLDTKAERYNKPFIVEMTAFAKYMNLSGDNFMTAEELFCVCNMLNANLNATKKKKSEFSIWKKQ